MISTARAMPSLSSLRFCLQNSYDAKDVNINTPAAQLLDLAIDSEKWRVRTAILPTATVGVDVKLTTPDSHQAAGTESRANAR